MKLLWKRKMDRMRWLGGPAHLGVHEINNRVHRLEAEMRWRY